MEKYFDLPEFCTRLISATDLHSQTASCVTPVSGNVASFASTHLTVGHLPSMQHYPQIRDPEWLKVEVCREFQRGACKRSAEECRYAHPAKNIQVSTDGKVIACYDALKGKCNRESCKYLHPTTQLKQQLEITGRQTLIQNRAMLQQMLPLQQLHTAAVPQAGLVGYEQVATGNAQPLLSGLHSSQLYSPTLAAATPSVASPAAYSVLQPTDLTAFNHHIMPYYPIAATPTQVAAMLPAPGSLRADRLEVCRDFIRGNCTRGEFDCRYGHPPDRSMIDTMDNTVTVCMDCIKGRCTREKCKYFHPPTHLQAKIRAAQNPATTILPPLSPPAIATPQPTVMMTNGSALGQPPLKRHAIESTVITSAGNAAATSPALTSTNSTSQSANLAALYGYSSTSVPGLTTVHHQTITPSPYYQQVPMQFHLQYGNAVGGLTATPAQTTPLTAFSIPTTSSATINASYALLNGQSQPSTVAGDTSAKPTHHVINTSYNLSTLTVCRDFQSGKCVRPFCRFVHVREDYVEIKDDKVTICRNALYGKCHRLQCKFYHIPNAAQSPHFTEPPGDAIAVGMNGPTTTTGLPGLLTSRYLPALQQPYPAVLAEGSGL